MKRVFSIVGLILIMLLVLTGCDGEANNTVNTNSTSASNSVNSSTANNTTTNSKETDVTKVDFAGNAKKQMAEPEEGEEIAIMHVKDYGEVYFKFFPQVAPKAVENFKTHSKDGYYNGLTFHRIMNEFMIQGGDPLGNGTGGESIWKQGFGPELDYSLVPYRGSLCMAMSSLPNSIGSQFFITQAHYDEQMGNQLSMYGYPKGLIDMYKENGGYLSLYMQYTVFGQAFKGMEIVDKIAQDSKPVDDNGTIEKANQPIIEKVEIVNYKK